MKTLRGLTIALALVGFIIWPLKPVPPRLATMPMVQQGKVKLLLGRSMAERSVDLPIPDGCMPEVILASLQFDSLSLNSDWAIAQVGCIGENTFRVTVLRMEPPPVARKYTIHWVIFCEPIHMPY